MSDSDLLYTVKDSIAWITINRESRRNALSADMMDFFCEYLDRAASDDQVRVVCVTAVGERAFCSGADLLGAVESGDQMAGAHKYCGLLKKMAVFSKPLVAKVNGHCMAGGMGLMLSCDLVYAREDVKFGTPEVKVGLFPMMIGALIFRNASRKKALEMILTAKTLSAAEADQMGLITRSCRVEDFERIVQETLSTIASLAPLAISLGRQALAAVESYSFDDSLDYLCDQLRHLAKTEDAMEGITAFLQKREPAWKGR